MILWYAFDISASTITFWVYSNICINCMSLFGYREHDDGCHMTNRKYLYNPGIPSSTSVFFIEVYNVSSNCHALLILNLVFQDFWRWCFVFFEWLIFVFKFPLPLNFGVLVNFANKVWLLICSASPGYER